MSQDVHIISEGNKNVEANENLGRFHKRSTCRKKRRIMQGQFVLAALVLARGHSLKWTKWRGWGGLAPLPPGCCSFSTVEVCKRIGISRA